MVATEYLFCGKVALEETRWHLDFTELIPRSPTIRMRNEKLIQFPANSHDMTAARQEERNPARTTGKPRESQRVGRRQNIDKRLWIYVSFSATRATGKLTIYKLFCITQTLPSAALLAPPAGCWAAVNRKAARLARILGDSFVTTRTQRAAFYALSDEDRAQQKEGETRRRRTTHSSSDMEKGIGTSGTRTERDQETRTNKPFRNTRARAQIVHVKPPPDTPSSFEATDVYIPGPETSVPDPDRTVGRGQKVSLRRVPA
ncbi:hypothetical protein Bbelb_421840 [Branchiostoma belcheri]|nr:hypothetical protein Bbelb_421840 [Branchiostoma belcheri]